MNEVQMKIVNLEGKKYFLVDSISVNEKFYHYFSNLVDNHDVLVMKDEIEDGNPLFISVDDDEEFDYALGLFYDKFYGNEEIKNTN